DVLGAGPQPSLVYDAAPDAGPEDDAEDERVPSSGPRQRLGQREAVGIVLETDGEVEPALEVGLERAPVETDRVRVLQPAVARRGGARRAAPDHRRIGCVGAELLDQGGHPLEDVLVALLALGRDAPPDRRGERLVEDDALDLRPTQVDPDGAAGRRPHGFALAQLRVYGPGAEAPHALRRRSGRARCRLPRDGDAGLARDTCRSARPRATAAALRRQRPARRGEPPRRRAPPGSRSGRAARGRAEHHAPEELERARLVREGGPAARPRSPPLRRPARL